MDKTELKNLCELSKIQYDGKYLSAMEKVLFVVDKVTDFKEDAQDAPRKVGFAQLRDDVHCDSDFKASARTVPRVVE